MATSVPGTGVAASLELELIFTLPTVHLSRAHLITRVTNTGNFRSLSEGYYLNNLLYRDIITQNLGLLPMI